MKKITTLALLAMIMVGCGGIQKNSDGSIVLDTYWKERSIDNPYLVTIDSCEYINWHYGFSHKGNCRFCKERRKQELKELVEQLKSK